MGASLLTGMGKGVRQFGAKLRQTGGVCVDVVGQPQISVIDFNGLTGADFVTGVGLAGFYVRVFSLANYENRIWFQTGTQVAPSAPDTGQLVMVTITAASTASDIAAATVSACAALSPAVFSMNQIDGGGTGTAAQFTNTQSGYANTAAGGSSSATASTTQSGYPSAHICSPTSDALAGISFAFRGQCTYLGVTANAGGLGQPGYTTQDLNGNQLLFQDSAMTIPAVNQGDTVAAIKDPISGLSAIQTNSMNCPTLQFSKNALGMLTPYLEFNGSGDTLVGTATGIQPNTWLIGFKGNSTTNLAILSANSGAFTNDQEIYGTASNWVYYAGTNQTGGTSDLNWHSITAVFNGSSSEFILDGSTISTANPGSANMAGGFRVASNAIGGSPANMYLDMVLLLQSSADSDQVSLVTSYELTLRP